MGFRSMIAGIPAVAMVAAFFLLSGYELHGKRLEKMQADVTALHAKKRETLEASTTS
jgi:Na+/melibiose symporter-like transporter